jgi:hypothetical protein
VLRANISLPGITSSDINSNTKSLVTFLCTGIDGSNNFTGLQSTKTYNLSSTNLSNNFLSQNLSGSTGTFGLSNYDYGLSLTQEEILNLHKSYKIIFRITDTSSPVTTASVQNGDIVQDFFLMLNTSEPGPYEPQFDYIDYMDPRYLSSAELNEIKSNCRDVPGKELNRIFYPKNINDLSALPMYFIASGTWHNALMYDTYASLLASYGYFVVIPSKYASVSIANSLRILQLYEDKLANGKFHNKLDYSKLYFGGHSLGANDAWYIYNKIINGETITPSIPDINLNYIKCIMNLEAAAGIKYPASIIGVTFGSKNAVGSVRNNYSSTASLGNVYKGETGCFQFIPIITSGLHENVGFAFSAFNDASELNNNVGSNNIISFSRNLGERKYNSKSLAIYKLAESVLIRFAIENNQILKKWYYNTNYTYLPNILYNNTKVIDYFYRLPDSNVSFIAGMTALSGFTYTGFTGVTLINQSQTVKQLYGTDDIYSSPLGNVYMRLHPLYSQIASYSALNYVGQTYPCAMFWGQLQGNSGSISFNYSSQPLNLTTHSHIALPMGASHLIGKTLIGGITNYVPIMPEIRTQHFGFELTDISSQKSIISSHQNNKGIYIPFCGDRWTYSDPVIKSTTNYGEYDNQSHCCKYMMFKLSDFKNQNPNIDLSQITGLKILFNSLYGLSGGITGAYAVNGILLVN